MGYAFDLSAVLSGEYLTWFALGVATTIALTCVAWCLGMAVGLMLTLIRMVPFRPFEWLVAFYVEYHRNVPLLVQILVWYFGVSQLLPRALRIWINANHGEFLLAAIALGLANAAYVSEDLRSGVRSILFVVAELVRRHDPDFAAFHRRLSLAGKPKKVIRVALAHKLLVRLNAKARDVRAQIACPA